MFKVVGSGAVLAGAPGHGFVVRWREPMRIIIDGQFLTWILVATVAVLIVPNSLQILSRYRQLFSAHIWTEEMSGFLLTWLVMLGAITDSRERTHFDVDVLPELSPRTGALLRVMSNFFVLISALVFLYR